MEKASIIIADQDPESLQNLKRVLEDQGYRVVATVHDGVTALKQVESLKPDIVILEHELPILDGLEVAKIVEEKKMSSVVLICARKNEDIIEQAKETWVFGYLIKPFDALTLCLTIEMAITNFNKIMVLEKELEKLKDSLESRKKIEKAKGILMKDFNITEPEAFRRLQKMSMDKRTSMEKISDAIMLTQD